MRKNRNRADVSVSNFGSIITLHLETEAAQEWVEHNVNVPAWARTRFGIHCEPRYAGTIVEAMAADGLEVA